MIARLPDLCACRRWDFAFIALFSMLILAGCEREPLPFPGEGQELVVITHAGPLTYTDEGGTPVGLEHDLVEMFAAELGVPVRFVVVPQQEVRKRLAEYEGHLAAGWLSPILPSQRFVYSDAYLETRDVLVRHEASLPIRELSQLKGQTVYAQQGSGEYRALRELQRQIPHLKVAEFPAATPLDVLAAVARREVEIALVDRAIVDIGLNYYPELQPGLEVGETQPIAWAFPADGDPELFNRAQAFLAKVHDNRALAMLRDRYLGHLERLGSLDVVTFIARMESLLPKYQPLFQQAQEETNIDWRLLAALSYQESHWNPLNTSPTGVRGIMMLTEETADRLGVSNRLNPNESIVAGARYVNMLKSYIPESTAEPDRTWQALAAYNIGPGHFNAARRLAGRMGVNGDSWFEMKKVLPLLARPEYYANLKSGRARGGEAVVLVENVRLFYDILLRYQPSYHPPEVERLERISAEADEAERQEEQRRSRVGLRQENKSGIRASVG
ncbi:MAG: membrane-bound lytic murein transglycosylase MltF [Zoogloeaceae bacterium]|jgi:membrane-bound lytic murein transglycosylase F|nr:membrane-bound lytic murein transglycosylase MltF [Zoogloeaceae bacterium]